MIVPPTIKSEIKSESVAANTESIDELGHQLTHESTDGEQSAGDIAMAIDNQECDKRNPPPDTDETMSAPSSTGT